MSGYLKEKLFVAMKVLATSEEPPKKRLAAAWTSGLHRVDVVADTSLTEEQRAKLRQLEGLFGTVQNNSLGSAAASADVWGEQEVEEAANAMGALILEL